MLKKQIESMIDEKVYGPTRIAKKIKPQKNFNFTAKQVDLFDKAMKDETRLIVIDGILGSGKTAFAFYTALELISKSKFESILYVRNPIEAGGVDLGALPGEAKDKLAPYGAPAFEKIKEFLPEQRVEGLLEVESLGFVRGRTFRNQVVVIDEGASLTKDDFILLLTRCSDTTKIFVLGDSKNQNDLKKKSTGWLAQFIDTFDDERSRQHGIHCLRLHEKEDIVRGKFIVFALEKLGFFDHLGTGVRL